MEPPFDLSQFAGFEWDRGNRGKSWLKHGVTEGECEETLFNLPVVVSPDTAHSETEARYHVLGQTRAGRRLFVVFTPRQRMIRVISARPMTRKERRVYEAIQKDTPKI